MDGRALIESREHQLRRILDYESHYTVPEFQREYSWQEDEISEFMFDVLSNSDSDTNTQYFFGTMFMHSDENDADNWIIVDGQQRMATSIIFLAVIYDMLCTLDPTMNVDIIKNSIKYNSIQNGIKPRLTLNHRNSKFFEYTILSDRSLDNKLRELKMSTITPENKLLASAYINIHQKLSFHIYSIENKENYLLNLATYFLKYFILSVNKIDDSETANIIFDSVNRKGIGLTENDFVKNALLIRIKKSGENVDQYHDDWLQILSKLKRINLDIDRFLRYYLLAYHKSVPSNQVAKIIMNQIDDGTITPVELINKLYDNSSSYEMFYTAEESFNGHEALVKNLNYLRDLDSNLVYPVLLLGHDKFDSLNKFDEFEKLVEIMLKYFFRFRTVCKIEPHSMESDIEKICEILSKPNPTIENIKSFIVNSPNYPSDDDFKLKFITFHPKKSVAKYILTEINNKNSSTPSTIFMEYIMPKKLTRNWLSYVKKTYGYETDTIYVMHKNTCKKIGNVTLLEKHNKSNSDIYQKKLSNIYSKSSINITKMLDDNSYWFADKIDYRTKQFAEVASNIWDLNNF